MAERMSKICPKCSSEAVEILRHNGIHYGDYRCPNCNRHLGFIPTPGDGSSKRPRKSKPLVDRYSRGVCELCRRAQSDLPKGQTLEAHHIIEVEEGGGDERGNVTIVCTPCHRLIHHQRTYIGGGRATYAGNLDERETPTMTNTNGAKRDDAPWS